MLFSERRKVTQIVLVSQAANHSSLEMSSYCREGDYLTLRCIKETISGFALGSTIALREVR